MSKQFCALAYLSLFISKQCAVKCIIIFSFYDIQNKQVSVISLGLQILIIPDITKTECNLLTPKTHQVYPKKWNTYGMGSKKWIIIICVTPDNIHTNKSRNYGRKVILKNANFMKLYRKATGE